MFPSVGHGVRATANKMHLAESVLSGVFIAFVTKLVPLRKKNEPCYIDTVQLLKVFVGQITGSLQCCQHYRLSNG